MELESLLNEILFRIGDTEIAVRQLASVLVSCGILLLLYRYLFVPLLHRYAKKRNLADNRLSSLLRDMRNVVLILTIIIVISIIKLDFVLYESEKVSIHIITVMEALLALQMASLLEWIFSQFFINRYVSRRDDEKEKSDLHTSHVTDPQDTGRKIIQYIVYTVAVLFIIHSFQLDFTIFSVNSNSDKAIPIRLSNVFKAILIILSSRLVVWILVQLILYGYYKRKEVNIGSQYAVNQLLSYVIYVVAALVALSSLGIKMTVIWGGAAALLVGIGFGLQQTFNDFISGIILLFERTVEVGDVVELSSLIGRVKRIGLRTSIVETWDNVAVVVPNSHLVSEQIINYSHNDIKTRYKVSVGVAYGSDTELVKELLLEAASQVKFVLDFPRPLIRFVSFGDSSLDFELHFWTHRLTIVENIKSDLLFAIDKLFRENDVEVPFPQRDMWVRNPVSFETQSKIAGKEEE